MAIETREEGETAGAGETVVGLEASLQALFALHGASVGARTPEQYLSRARGFSENLRGALRYPAQGTSRGVVRYSKLGTVIEFAPDGTIVSFLSVL